MLWDAATQKLYVASHVYSLNAGQLAAAAERGRLYRYTYSAATKTYTLDAGFPVEANPSKTETLVLAKDSTGKLWMSYADTQRVLINHTLNGDDRVWGSPYVLPVADASNLTNDDISSVIAFAGKIGVLWSNQNTKKMYFAVHTDGDSDQLWQSTAVYTVSADDHINLKSLESDPAGQVFAAIKTSQSSALIVLLVCTSGSCSAPSNWISRTAYSSGTHSPTRPILLVDTSNRELYIFSRNRDSSGHDAIYYKKTPLDSPQFDATTIGTPFIRSASNTNLNDPTSTKQTLNSTTGLAVLASDNYYFHNHAALAGNSGPPSPGAPVISSFSPTSGLVGVSITIMGSQFNGTTQVTFAGTPGNFTVNSDTQLQATVPAGATSGKIAVTSPSGTGTSSADFGVIVAPAISSFSPTSGVVGTVVTLTGTGFVATTAVAFNGRAAATFTVNSNTQITVTVPTGATTGKISVTTPGGTALTATDYVVTAVANVAFVPVADAQVRNANPTTNYGAVTTLRTRQGDASNPITYHSYLKFDVTGLSGTLASAKLRLFATASNSTGILVYSSDSGWTETSINWNNAPLQGALRGSSGPMTQNTWVEITLPPSMFTFNQAYTLVLAGQTSQSAYFSSKEGTNKPQLILSVGP